MRALSRVSEPSRTDPSTVEMPSVPDRKPPVARSRRNRISDRSPNGLGTECGLVGSVPETGSAPELEPVLQPISGRSRQQIGPPVTVGDELRDPGVRIQSTSSRTPSGAQSRGMRQAHRIVSDLRREH